MAASVAAISLHALLFTLLPTLQDTALLAPEGSLQVELLAQKHAAPSHATTGKKNQLTAHTDRPSRPLRPRLQQQQSSFITADKQNQLTAHTGRPAKPLRPRLQQQPLSMTARPSTRLATVQRVTEALQESQAEELETAALSATHPLAADQSDRSSDASSGAIVPQNIQKHILAQVHYPKQARRHGWQGRAEFQLNVHQQSIHTVTLLASTGHPILDRAARRGLTSMRQVPLSNGLYRMPVIFHLK